MPNTQAVGVAFADPALVAGTTITSATVTSPAITGGTVTGGTLDSTTLVNSNVRSGFTVSQQGATIATTGNSDVYVTAPVAGTLSAAWFAGVDALTANDTNYITFSITNLATGSGTNAMLAATDANTTKATGGTGLSANTRRVLTLNGTAANLVVAAGDRIRIRAAVTNTLANTVTFPVYSLQFTVA